MNEHSAKRRQKVLILGLLILPVVIVVVIIINGLRGREMTPKWEKEEPAATEAADPGPASK